MGARCPTVSGWMGKVGVDWQEAMEKRNNGHAGRWRKDQKGGGSQGRNAATRKGRRLRSTGEMNPARIIPAPYNVQSSRAGFSRRAKRYDAMLRHAGAFLSANKSALLRKVPRVRFLRALCAKEEVNMPCVSRSRNSLSSIESCLQKNQRSIKFYKNVIVSNMCQILYDYAIIYSLCYAPSVCNDTW